MSDARWSITETQLNPLLIFLSCDFPCSLSEIVWWSHEQCQVLQRQKLQDGNFNFVSNLISRLRGWWKKGKAEQRGVTFGGKTTWPVNCSCKSRPVFPERCAPAAVDDAKMDADELQKDADDGVRHWKLKPSVVTFGGQIHLTDYLGSDFVGGQVRGPSIERYWKWLVTSFLFLCRGYRPKPLCSGSPPSCEWYPFRSAQSEQGQN